MSLFSMSLAEPAVATQREARPLARFARPMLGLVLPVGLAIAWEIAVRVGLSDGRLVPPPSRIYQEFAELAATGELQRHFIATVLRVVVGFALGTVAGTLLGAIAGYSAIVRRLVDPTLRLQRHQRGGRLLFVGLLEGRLEGAQGVGIHGRGVYVTARVTVRVADRSSGRVFAPT